MKYAKTKAALSVSILAALLAAGSSRSAVAEGDCDVCDDYPSLPFGNCRLQHGQLEAHAKIGWEASGGWYMGVIHIGSKCGGCGYHTQCPGGAPPTEPPEGYDDDDGEGFAAARNSGERDRMRQAVDALGDLAYIDSQRQRLIVHGCGGSIMAQYQLTASEFEAVVGVG